MAAKTAAQEEFDNFVAGATRGPKYNSHPEDRKGKEQADEIDEETAFQQRKIDTAMSVPVYDRNLGLHLPPPSLDAGRYTGVKGVIADARSFVETRRGNRTRSRRQSPEKANRFEGQQAENYLHSDSEDDEGFLEQWREARRKEMLREGNDIRNRRTSPSMRRYGRFDEVDALGYLDAIEHVGRETTVVVFVYDVEVCSTFSLALLAFFMPSYASFRC
jgi:hypothetical protein